MFSFRGQNIYVSLQQSSRVAGMIRDSIDGFLIVRMFSYPTSYRLSAVCTIAYSIDISTLLAGSVLYVRYDIQ